VAVRTPSELRRPDVPLSKKNGNGEALDSEKRKTMDTHRDFSHLVPVSAFKSEAESVVLASRLVQYWHGIRHNFERMMISIPAFSFSLPFPRKFDTLLLF
jgi:hypothetical protein